MSRVFTGMFEEKCKKISIEKLQELIYNLEHEIENIKTNYPRKVYSIQTKSEWLDLAKKILYKQTKL